MIVIRQKPDTLNAAHDKLRWTPVVTPEKAVAYLIRIGWVITGVHSVDTCNKSESDWPCIEMSGRVGSDTWTTDIPVEAGPQFRMRMAESIAFLSKALKIDAVELEQRILDSNAI